MPSFFASSPSVFFSLVALAGISMHAKAQEAPVPATGAFSFLDALSAESQARDPDVAVSRAVETERQAAVETARAGHLPTLGLSASTGPSRTWQWNNGGLMNRDDRATWNTQGGVSLRQNLWAGGLTRLRTDSTELRLEAGRIDTRRTQSALTLSLAQDLARILSAVRSLKEDTIILDQARRLESIATRKNKSGFLGSKELLDTQREALRSEFSLRNARARLAERIALFNRAYHLKEQALTEERALALAPKLDALTRAPEETLAGVDFLANNLDLKVSEFSLQAVDKDVESARVQRLSPSLDLSAGLNGTLYDNGNVAREARGLAPDRGLNASGQLSFSMNVFAPSANAAATEAIARKATVLGERARAEDALRRAAEQLRAERALLVAQIADQRRLLATTEDLFQKNTRLFEAGTFDVLAVIASQQTVARDRQTLVDLEGQLQQSTLQTLAARDLGVFSAAGAATSSTGNAR